MHLGDDCAVPQRHVLAILDMRCAEAADTKAFLQGVRERCQVTQLREGPTRSMVITVDGEGAQRVYLSPIAPQTLRARTRPLERLRSV